MGSAYPDLYAAIGVHSGLACGAAKDLPSAFAAMSRGAPIHTGRHDRPAMPTIVFHGDHDRTVSPINADHVLAQSKGGARLRTIESRGTSKGGVGYLRTVQVDDNDLPVLERWQLHGAGHAWSGGSAAGTYTDPHGPDASCEMVRFFLQRRLANGA
jgi:poly(3-hydroxybutyrate) depolymerase